MCDRTQQLYSAFESMTWKMWEYLIECVTENATIGHLLSPWQVEIGNILVCLRMQFQKILGLHHCKMFWYVSEITLVRNL